MVRKLLSISLFVLALCAIAFVWMNDHVYTEESIDEGIRNNQEIAALFNQSRQFVSDFRKQNGRLPSPGEFDRWAAGHGNELKTPTLASIKLAARPFPKEAVEEFGEPPDECYLLATWRGEWFDYFSSWQGRTSMYLSRRDAYRFGSNAANRAVGIGLVLLLLVACRVVWPNPSFKRTRLRRSA